MIFIDRSTLQTKFYKILQNGDCDWHFIAVIVNIWCKTRLHFYYEIIDWKTYTIFVCSNSWHDLFGFQKDVKKDIDSEDVETL